MPVLARNHRQIQAVKADPRKRVFYRIDGVPGLELMVTSAGVKSWYARYQVASTDGRRIYRRYRIGNAASVDLAEATEEAKRIYSVVEVAKRDPFAEERAAPLDTKAPETFQDLFDAWNERHAKLRLAVPEIEQRRYEMHLKDELGDKTLAEITRHVLSDYRDKIAVEQGPIQSNNVITLFNRIMNWAVDVGRAEYNPANRLRKVGTPRPRERVLSDDELRALWLRLSEMDAMTGEHMARGEKGRILTPLTRAAIRILILTGQRRSEVMETQRSELLLNSSEPAWTIPGNRTKNSLLHRLPLPPLAAAEFRAAIKAGGSESSFVFPSPLADADNDIAILPSTVTRAVERVCGELGIRGVGPHDLRRTLGTGLARLGVPENVRALILNHSPRSRSITDAVYNRYAYDKEKRQALELWEKHVRSVVASSHQRNSRTASA
jgi:integrase